MRYSALVFLMFLLLQCRQAAPSKPLRVAVAANVQYAMQELEEAFEAQTGLEVEAVISSSGKLTAQIAQGAPYHLFLSADLKYPEYLLEQGHAAGRIQCYARGLLVCWTLDESLNLQSDPSFLLDSLQGRVAVAQPELAPYGLAARAHLQAVGLWDSLQPRLVFGESIAQVNQYVLSGAAPLGFTAKSVVLAPDLQARGRWVEIEARHYPAIEQGAVMTQLGKTAREADCRRFLDFLLSSEGQRILERYGYLRSRPN